MSRSATRIQDVIDRLNYQFENSPHITAMPAEDGDTTVADDVLLSVIIPARNEFPNVVHTVHSILNCWEADGFNGRDIEIIIVDNCSTDWEDDKYEYEHLSVRGTTSHLMPRRVYWSGTVRVLYDPIAGNHAARNKGVAIARGEYVFFSDAHMSYAPGFFKYGLETVRATGGLVHGGIGWMGGYPPDASGVGMQYTIKLGEEWKGTWNNYRPWSNDWFYIPAQGHCSVFANRRQFLDFGGYPKVHRTYGGGEFYLDMKWWMFGSSVAADPRCIGYHLASSRGYSWHHDDYIHNVFNCAYALSCDDWLERTYLNYCRRSKKDVLDRMMAEAKKEMAEDRAFINERKVFTFNELLVEKPWDKQNIERKGVANSSMLIFHETWVKLLESAPAWVGELYRNSDTQKELARFIDEHLSASVYKRGSQSQENPAE